MSEWQSMEATKEVIIEKLRGALRQEWLFRENGRSLDPSCYVHRMDDYRKTRDMTGAALGDTSTLLEYGNIYQVLRIGDIVGRLINDIPNSGGDKRTDDYIRGLHEAAAMARKIVEEHFLPSPPKIKSTERETE